MATAVLPSMLNSELDLVMKENQDIADHIENIATGDYSNDQIENLLSRLVSNMKSGWSKHIQAPDIVIYDACSFTKDPLPTSTGPSTMDPCLGGTMEMTTPTISTGKSMVLMVRSDRNYITMSWMRTGPSRKSSYPCLDAPGSSVSTRGKSPKPTWVDKSANFLTKIIVRQKVPREVHAKILGYLPYRDELPYLRGLDIAAAYSPFPEVGEQCLSCDELDPDSSIKRTCPQQSLYIWNLALRLFHTFHMNGPEWALCVHGVDCPGHHDCKDGEWVVNTDEAFIEYIEKEVAKANGLSVD
ncbi:hypothetical protein ACHAPU_007428 [Fusarium lateritium]